MPPRGRGPEPRSSASARPAPRVSERESKGNRAHPTRQRQVAAPLSWGALAIRTVSGVHTGGAHRRARRGSHCGHLSSLWAADGLSPSPWSRHFPVLTKAPIHTQHEARNHPSPWLPKPASHCHPSLSLISVLDTPQPRPHVEAASSFAGHCPSLPAGPPAPFSTRVTQTNVTPSLNPRSAPHLRGDT